MYDDNCFYFTAPPRNETDSDGKTREVVDEEHVKFELKKDFALSYYRDEIKAKGLNPDYPCCNSKITTTKEVQAITVWKAK